jgi:hypothetical protein
MVKRKRSPRELARCVEHLVRAATPDANPRELQDTVEEVLNAFDEAPASAREAAVRSIAKALGKGEGRGAQILSLTLGAVVEGGASPELAWPAISRDLHTTMEGAVEFAKAAFKSVKTEAAARAAIASVEKRKPKAAAAWSSLPSRCLAAVACLTRSKGLRAKTRKDKELVAAAWSLSEVVPEVGVMLQAIRILDDTTLLVLAPGLGLGWHIAIDAIPSNLELYVLLADAIGGRKEPGADREGLSGKRIDPKAVAVIKGGPAPKKPPVATFPFELVAWTAVRGDGSLAPAHDRHDHDHDHGSHDHDHDEIPVAGVPADIPMLGEQRVVLVRKAVVPERVEVEPTFEAVRPELSVIQTLAPGDVVRTMITLAQAAASEPEEAPSSKSAKSAKKATPKKAKSKKPSSRAKK